MDAAPYYLQVDALYFQARENGVQYAIANDRVMYPEFKSHWGARAALGVDLHHDCWKAVLQFLHFHARTRQDKFKGPFFPTWVSPLLGDEGFVDSVYDMWRLHMGLADLYVTRPLNPSNCLEIWPYFGLRYSEIRHKLRIYYQGGTMFPGTEDDVSMKNKFWGLGPVGGAEAIWRLNSWLGIFTRGTGSLTYGKLYVHQDQEILETGEFVNFLNVFYQVRCILDLALGLDFRYCRDDCCFSVNARIGWEAYLLFGQNQFARFPSKEMPGNFFANQGDLSLHGLSVGIGIGF